MSILVSINNMTPYKIICRNHCILINDKHMNCLTRLLSHLPLKYSNFDLIICVYQFLGVNNFGNAK